MLTSRRAPFSVSRNALIGVLVPAEGKCRPFGERLAGVVPDSGDPTAGGVLDGERFQDIVHLRRFEIQARALARPQLTAALEVTYAVLGNAVTSRGCSFIVPPDPLCGK